MSLDIYIEELVQQKVEESLRRVVREELDARDRPKDILTRKQLSERYGWSSTTIWRKMRKGLPHFGGVGEHPRFKKSEVDRWLTEQSSYL